VSDGCSNCDDWEGNPEMAVCSECWPEKIKRLQKENQTIIDKAYEQAEKDRKHIEELESALRPFAECKASPIWPGVNPKEQYLWVSSGRSGIESAITLADIYAARKALGADDG
jgi:hypothetical protein